MQEAFRENHGLQCGFCTPGMIMSAIDMVNRKGIEPRRARPSAKSSRAISVAAPATTTSSRPSPRVPPRWPDRRIRRAAEWIRSRVRRGRSQIKNSIGEEDVVMTTTGMGAAVRRKEDHRFITGKGNYTDDINRPGQAHAYFLRSPHAHATSASIDIDKAAAACPACVGILHRRGPRRRQDRRADLRLDDPFQGRLADEGRAASARWPRARCAMSATRSRSSVAETLAQAKDAAEAVIVDYEVLPAVTETAKAAGQGRPPGARRRARQHDLRVAARRQGGDGRRPSRRPSTSPSSTSSTTAWCPTRWSRAPRSATMTAAPRAFTLYTTSQNPHVARLVLSAFVGIAPEHKLRVIAPDVGGGFGSKIFIYAEETVCVWAAKTRRPAGEMDQRPHRRPSSSTRMAATTSPMPSWRSTRTGRITRPAGQDRSPISAPTCRPSPPRCRPISMPRCCRASTTSRRSMPRSTRSTPTPRRSTPIAAPAGRRRASWSSG